MLKIDKNRLEQFFYEHYHDELVDTNQTVYINHQLLDCYYCDLVDDMKDNYKVQQKRVSKIFHDQRIQRPQELTQVKFYNVRPIIPLSELHQAYNGKFVSFEGIVKKRSKVQNKITEVHWACKQCKAEQVYTLQYNDELHPPKTVCTNCNRNKGYRISNSSKYKDIQLITVQEPLDTLKQGFQPTEVKVYLENELINTVKPGDKIRINGVLELRNQKKKNLFTEYVIAENIEQLEQDFEDIQLSQKEINEIKELAARSDIFELIKKSTAPTLYGNDELKLAIALQLFNSQGITKFDGSYTRGDIHILMVGDPGVGKSQILKYVSNLAPRCVYASGKGSSGAGLTATAVKDEMGSWSLEAGAMVLADNGNVCIDEFDKMREDDRSAIHEALEQQTISISKAGINATLNSRCSVLAAANPKFGNFNKHKSISEQIKLSSPILSRFDLIFILLDEVNRDKDHNIALSILQSQMKTGEELIQQDMFRKYISYARKNINPELSEEACLRIADFFTEWRVNAEANGNPIPITARQLESVMRLARASARVRLSDVVSLEDAERAIGLQEFCMKHVGFDIEVAAPNANMMMGGPSEATRKNKDEMMSILEGLRKNWGDKISLNVVTQTLKDKDFKMSLVEQWLIEEDASGTILFDPDEHTVELKTKVDKGEEVKADDG